MHKVSIIVPVYNVELYLEQCLNSIINQTYKNLEIICVNDGSTDNSGKILKNFALKDNRIKIINFQKNKGVSAARNAGMDIASGEYIYFIDSDDWIGDSYIESMVDAIEISGADIVINRNIIFVYDNHYEKYTRTSIEIELKDNSFVDISKNAHGISPFVWSKLYRKDFLQKYNLTFPEGYILEDIFFHYAAFVFAHSVYYYKGTEYYYYQRNNSISYNIKNQCRNLIKIFDLVYDFYKERDVLSKYIKIFYITPSFCIDNEETYYRFKQYFQKTKNYILESGIYNDLECFLCNIILNTKDYADYKSKYRPNIAMNFIRDKKH